MPFERGDRWRELAEEMRRLAGEMQDHEGRAKMLQIAFDWEKRAKDADLAFEQQPVGETSSTRQHRAPPKAPI
jgi:hypothetical protein